MRSRQSTEDSSSSARPQDSMVHSPGPVPSDRTVRNADGYRAILEALPTAVALIVDHRPTYFNPAFCQLFGYSEEETLNQPTQAYFADFADFERVVTECAPVIARGGIFRAEFAVQRKGGVRFWVSATARRLLVEPGIAAALWAFEDVSERRQAEADLRQSEQRFEVAQAQALIGSWELGPQLDGRYWSRQMYWLFGFEPSQELPSVEKYFERIHPDDVPSILQAHQRVIETRKPGRIAYRSNPDFGDLRYFEATVVPYCDEQGNILKIIGTTQDVTERWKLEAQLQQTSKMEAIGRLAGGVAHDFNNLLSVIGGNVELAREELTEDSPAWPYLSEVLEASANAEALTRQLLAFSRRQLIEPRVVIVNAIIERLQKMLGRLIGEDITLELLLDPELGAVRIDPGQLNQVIVNLIVNARDAMPGGGRVILETANIELDPEYCSRHSETSPGHFVMLAVTDTGEGIPPELRSRIFEPFFSTKPQGKGTGLGLSVTFGVVKQAGGSIEVYSELNHGTTFKIYLPRVDEAPVRLKSTAPTAPIVEGTETILLVEDNDAVRDVTAKMLQRLGYTPIVAASGSQALSIVNGQKPAIDLLLTDLVMPEMSGRELAEVIGARYPDIAVLYCSGYTEDTFVRLGLASQQLAFISKPFTLHQLGAKVRQLLDQRRSGEVNVTKALAGD